MLHWDNSREEKLCWPYHPLTRKSGLRLTLELGLSTLALLTFGSCILFCWGGEWAYPIQYWMHSKIPGLYSQEASSLPLPAVTTRYVSDIANSFLGANQPLRKNHFYREAGMVLADQHQQDHAGVRCLHLYCWGCIHTLLLVQYI